MHELIREDFSSASFSAKELTRHLYTRVLCGKVVIVTEKPASLLPTIRKQWLKLARKVQTERLRTLNALRTTELSNMTARMQSLRFTTQWPPDVDLADVYVVTVDQVLQWAPEARTLYIACSITTEQLYLITAWMPKGGLVVVYKLLSKGADQNEG